jgi:hypothetical protein
MEEDKLFSDAKLKQFGSEYVAILTKYLLQYKKNSSGQLIKSLNYKIVQEAEQINIIIVGAAYLKYVDEGRKPGSYPPINKIAQWAKIKGISPEAVFPIARKIFRFGIKPTNIIDKTIKEITSPRLISQIEKEAADNIEQIVKNTLEKNQ